LKKFITSFFMAWGMFFAVPCPLRIWDEKLRGAMLLCLPLIGALTGGLWVLLAYLLGLASCPALVAAAFLTLLPGALTGFIHMDGFMDCCDAILSRRDLEGRRRILKDPHSGSFAVISLGAVFLLEFSFFSSASLRGRIWALLFLPIVSRLCSVLAICRCEPMPGSSYAGTFRGLIKPQYGHLALCLLLLACVLPIFLFGPPGLSAAAVAAGSLFAIWDGRRQLGGMSGDISGFGIVCGELCGIAVLTLA
jgi:adenosylcobinamide-GDP ribazoletransferase